MIDLFLLKVLNIDKVMKTKKLVWILSFRIAGNDGVSLEAVRWGNIFKRHEFKVKYVAGDLDRRGIVIPELHFNSPEVYELHQKIVYGNNNYKSVQAEIFKIAGKIEGALRDALNGKKPDLLVVANVFSLPMHFPLSISLKRIIEEYKIPTIARHHDFWWERKRYLKSSMFPFFKKWFPPDLPEIRDVVINSISQKELKKRFNLGSDIITDCFDFSSKKLSRHDGFSKNFRKDFGITPHDIVFLQPTRIVPRKRIEVSIDLIKKLNNPNIVLVIAGHSGDEGHEYENKLHQLTKEYGSRVLFIGDFVNSRRRIIPGTGRRVYTLWDAFKNADFITYPTELEGFGNQFIESVYFKKPVIITPYEVYKKDIKPLGFGAIEITPSVAKKDVNRVLSYLNNTHKIKSLVEKNFMLGQKHFSYEATWKKIKKLI